jgi:hypothetical protein
VLRARPRVGAACLGVRRRRRHCGRDAHASCRRGGAVPRVEPPDYDRRWWSRARAARPRPPASSRADPQLWYDADSCCGRVRARGPARPATLSASGARRPEPGYNCRRPRRVHCHGLACGRDAARRVPASGAARPSRRGRYAGRGRTTTRGDSRRRRWPVEVARFLASSRSGLNDAAAPA